LSDIADLSKGIGISKDQLSADGEPCILYGELYTKYKSETIKEVISKTNIDNTTLVKSKANDVIIPCSGETAEEIATARCVLKDDILLGGDLNIIRLHGYDGSFMSYQLNGKRKYDIAKVAQGVSVVHLYGEHLKNIKTINPSLNEQKKIANLLSLLDERISTQNKIIEDLKKLKSAISERLFKDAKGDVITLSEICDIVKGEQINGELLSEHGKYYVMNGGTDPSGYYDNYNVGAYTISISEGGNFRKLSAALSNGGRQSAAPSRTTAPDAVSGNGLTVGATIEHQRFGIGVVEAMEGTGENAKATVTFRNAGTKQLLLKFAKYKIL